MFYMGYGVFLLKEYENPFSALYYFNLSEDLGRNTSERFFSFLAKLIL